MNILVTLDRNYLPPLRVMLGSLLRNDPGETFEIYAIGDGLMPEDWAALEELCAGRGRIHPLEVPADLFADAPVARYWTRAMYYRLLAAELLPRSLDRVLYLETMKDVSEVFRDRSLGFSVYRRVTVAMLLCGTAVMYLIASFLTRPIRLLTRATKRMASGDYHHRARKVSSDELGQLTTDLTRWPMPWRITSISWKMRFRPGRTLWLHLPMSLRRR